MNPRDYIYPDRERGVCKERRGKRTLSLWVVFALLLFVASCASFPGRHFGSGECRPDKDIALKDRLDHAIAYLSADDFCNARAEVAFYMEHNPRSATAEKLLFAIDTDPYLHWGDKAFDYTVERGDSLAVLSEVHLGDMLLFPMLARYNHISAEGLRAGAIIRIPGAPPEPEKIAAIPVPSPPAGPSEEDMEKARAFIADGDALLVSENFAGAYDAYYEAASIDETSEDARRKMLKVSHAAADIYHRKAVEAIRDQRPELAIVFWKRVLEIAPDHPHAPSGLERAQVIVSKIARLKE